MSLQMHIKNGFVYYDEPSINERNDKGKSLIELPDDYTVIDVETTGYDFTFDSIIEIAAVRVRHRKPVDSFSSLVKPPKLYILNDDSEREDELGFPVSLLASARGYYVDEFITQKTGITNDMLETAPEPKDVIPAFLSFVGNDILVGHNVNFDVNFIYDSANVENCGALRNNFVDTLRISRKTFPNLEHHRLEDVALACSVPYKDAHRSFADCSITFSCFEKMREIISSRFPSFADFKKLFTSHTSHSGRINCSQFTAQTSVFNEDHPFYHKNVVFTGALSGLIRQEAMQLVLNVGGYIADSVTKKTNYLVVGSFDFIKSVKGNKSTKIKKAEKMILDGYDITIISEKTFKEYIKND